MRWKVDIITGTRAEFGLLTPLIRRMINEDSLETRIIATGSHLMERQGYTIEEIRNAGFDVFAELPLPDFGDTPVAMTRVTGMAIAAFAAHLNDERPDLVVLLGDRYETFAACTAAAMLGIPVAHICGGEVTEGAIDDFLRHAITKMSVLHLTSREEYRRRVIQLGEQPDTVFNVGQLGAENALNIKTISLSELEADLGFPLVDRDYCLVTYHPVTMLSGSERADVTALIGAMNDFPEMSYIITKANADAGGDAVNSLWEEEAQNHENWLVTASLGMVRYVSALRNAKLMLGNSSSGLTEAPALGVPTVNIGMRQAGRVLPGSVISCQPVSADIHRAMEVALSEKFRAHMTRDLELAASGDTSKRILDHILNYLRDRPGTVAKKFYDVNPECLQVDSNLAQG